MLIFSVSFLAFKTQYYNYFEDIVVQEQETAMNPSRK